MMLADIWGSAKSISDMVSNPDIVDDSFKETDLSNIVNGYDAYIDGSLPRKLGDSGYANWDLGVWHTCPDEDCKNYLYDNYKSVSDAVNWCRSTFAFRGEAALTPEYV